MDNLNLEALGQLPSIAQTVRDALANVSAADGVADTAQFAAITEARAQIDVVITHLIELAKVLTACIDAATLEAAEQQEPSGD